MRLLRSLAPSDGDKAKVFGFDATYGSIRALFVALLTVAFAFWGVLRGVGVQVVLDSVCPGLKIRSKADVRDVD